MPGFRRFSSFLFLAACCFSVRRVGADSMMYIVGKSFGWNVPGNDSFYQDWAKTRHFIVGDRLVFLFHQRLENVMEVGKEDFETCTHKHVIKSHFNAPAIVELKKPGDHYFSCSNKNHCQGGQKIKVTVAKRAGDYQQERKAQSPVAGVQLVFPSTAKSPSKSSYKLGLFFGLLMCLFIHHFL